MPATPSWYQQALTPPAAIECNIRIGVIPGSDHAQVLVELKDPATLILLAQASCPHDSARRLPELIDWCGRTATKMLDDALEPF